MKKETTFHWYKEDDEIVPETPPNVMSGACALPLTLVKTQQYNSKTSNVKLQATESFFKGNEAILAVMRLLGVAKITFS